MAVTVDNTGHYEVNLFGPIDHPLGNGENTATIQFGVNVSDGIAVPATTTLTVVVEDDSPILGAFDPGTLPNQVGTVTGEFVLAAGADGLDHFNITGPSITGVSYTTTTLADGTTTLHGAPAGGGADIFTLTARPDGTYTYALVNPDSGISETFDMTNISAGGPRWLETEGGRLELSSPQEINSNNDGFGTANLFVGSGESFTMEFHDPGTIGNDAPSTNAQFVDSAQLKVEKLVGSGGTYTWIAANTVTGAVQTGTIIINGTGLYLVDPNISFNSLTIVGTDVDGKNGKGAQFSAITTTQNIVPHDLLLNFQVQAVDNDGDLSAAQQLSIHQVGYHPPGQGQAEGGYTLTGFAGDAHDWIAASTMVDTISGGAGFDVVDYSHSVDAVSLNLDDAGHVSGIPGNLSDPGEGKIGGGNATGDSLSGIEGIVGGHGHDTLYGNASANYIDGGAENDTIKGEDGNDVLIGGTGADTIDGGAGNDHITYDGADVSIAGGADADTLVVNGAATIDLSATADQSLGDTAIVTGFEHVDASGAGVAVNLTGDGNANVLTGGAGNDTLHGGAGNDTLTGGAGNDILSGGLGNDILTGGTGADTFKASGGNEHITDYNKAEGDVVDLSELLSGATRSNLSVEASDDGLNHAKLTIQDSGGAELGSVTFDTVDHTAGMSVDSLLGHIDVEDGSGHV